jgi:hypothetical protein
MKHLQKKRKKSNILFFSCWSPTPTPLLSLKHDKGIKQLLLAFSLYIYAALLNTNYYLGVVKVGLLPPLLS